LWVLGLWVLPLLWVLVVGAVWRCCLWLWVLPLWWVLPLSWVLLLVAGADCEAAAVAVIPFKMHQTLIGRVQ
jgi:hypothetical protein